MNSAEAISAFCIGNTCPPDATCWRGKAEVDIGISAERHAPVFFPAAAFLWKSRPVALGVVVMDELCTTVPAY